MALLTASSLVTAAASLLVEPLPPPEAMPPPVPAELLAHPLAAVATTEGPPLQAFWNDGLPLASPAGDFANQMTDFNMAFPTLAGPGVLPGG